MSDKEAIDDSMFGAVPPSMKKTLKDGTWNVYNTSIDRNEESLFWDLKADNIVFIYTEEGY